MRGDHPNGFNGSDFALEYAINHTGIWDNFTRILHGTDSNISHHANDTGMVLFFGQNFFYCIFIYFVLHCYHGYEMTYS